MCRLRGFVRTLPNRNTVFSSVGQQIAQACSSQRILASAVAWSFSSGTFLRHRSRAKRSGSFARSCSTRGKTLEAIPRCNRKATSESKHSTHVESDFMHSYACVHRYVFLRPLYLSLANKLVQKPILFKLYRCDANSKSCFTRIKTCPSIY